ncbi:creatininase family protein [Spirosoma sp. KNUC1025]|uniref:creatininase family protein n=1 Tax=Spirosoma sp. KNUC1025 TaxID=2894082 RepID=UPI00386E3A22|nr:creatininase family protein [Spirosoma sp. KNUC1025]
MKPSSAFILALWLVSTAAGVSQSIPAKGIFLDSITWLQAAKQLTPQTVVVIPLGAQAKEHGPHLPLGTDYIQAQFFARQIATTEPVVIAPQLNYGFYFPFITFPGSTSLRHSVAKLMVVDICRGLAAFGPKRFYVINEGIATNAVLKPAADLLAREGILLSFTDLRGEEVEALVKRVQQQKEGSHADEIETSKILYMQPKQVNMKLAKQEYGIRKGRGFPTYDSTQNGHYIPSGIYGDATLASYAKGKTITEGMLHIIKADLDRLRQTSLPAVKMPDVKLYTGQYETADKTMATISDDQGLVCQFSSFPAEKLHADGDNYFAGFYYEIWFQTNDAGDVISLRLVDVGGRISLAKKVK